MLYKVKNSNNWYIKVKYKGRVFRKSTRTSNKGQAQRIHDAYREELHGFSIYASTGDIASISREWRAECNRAIRDSKSWLCRAHYSASKKNRDRFGIKPLTKKAMLQIALRSNGRCVVTGLPFTFEDTEKSAQKNPKNPCCASIDRIDSRYGYTVNNCRFVLLAVNLAMLDWGEDIFWAIAEGAVASKLRNAAHISIRRREDLAPLDKHMSDLETP